MSPIKQFAALHENGGTSVFTRGADGVFRPDDASEQSPVTMRETLALSAEPSGMTDERKKELLGHVGYQQEKLPPKLQKHVDSLVADTHRPANHRAYTAAEFQLRRACTTESNRGAKLNHVLFVTALQEFCRRTGYQCPGNIGEE